MIYTQLYFFNHVYQNTLRNLNQLSIYMTTYNFSMTNTYSLAFSFLYQLGTLLYHCRICDTGHNSSLWLSFPCFNQHNPLVDGQILSYSVHYPSWLSFCMISFLVQCLIYSPLLIPLFKSKHLYFSLCVIIMVYYHLNQLSSELSKNPAFIFMV